MPRDQTHEPGSGELQRAENRSERPTINPAFNMSDVADADARVAGRRFARANPDAGRPSANGPMVAGLLQLPDVPQGRRSENAAARLVHAFVLGAGRTSSDAGPSWDDQTRRRAIETVGQLVRRNGSR